MRLGEIHGNPHFGWHICLYKQTGKHGMAGQRSLIQIGWFLLFFASNVEETCLKSGAELFFDSKTWLVSGDILCLWQRVGTRFFHPRDDSRSMGPWHVWTSSSLGGQLLKGHVDMGNVIRGYVTMDERYIKNQDGAIPILGRIVSQWRRRDTAVVYHHLP